MEKTQRYSERKDREERQEKRKKINFFKTIIFFFIATIHYSWATFIAVLLMLGIINLCDILVIEDVPQINDSYSLRDKMPNEYSDTDLCKNFDSDRAWDAIQPALKILDVVCPEASAWARSQKKSGKIIWDSKFDETAARYDQVKMSLTINADMFGLKNSEIACTIAHEFRHSRQNISKSYKSAFSLLLTGTRNPDIIEDDAYFFEAKVREAINGY